MRIHVEKNRKRLLAVIGMTVLLAVLELMLVPAEHMLMHVGAVLALAILALSLLVKVEVKSKWMLPVVLLITAFSGVFLLHIGVNGEPLKLGAFVYNMHLSLMFPLLILAITGRVKLSCGIWVMFCSLFGVIDSVVYDFRGSLIVVNDVMSIGTALSVMDNYQLSLDARMLTGAIMAVAVPIILFRASLPQWKQMRKISMRLLMVVLAVLLALLPVSHLGRYKTYTWANRAAQGPGILYEFALELYNMKVDEPENYSIDAVNAIAEEYTTAEVTDERKPHVIAIMIEAWSDLTVLGDVQTDVEVMPWLTDFMDETIHGYAVSTVYGGNTATSEWEFLTGNSMAFLPAGSMVYRQFVRDDIRTIVDVMEANGYSSLAMHPYYAAGWDRNRIYDMIGFDKTLFLEDLDWGEKVRKYVSDDAFVNVLIDEFEARDKDKPMFLFGITMQNHGGYYDEFDSTVHVTSLEGDMSKANQYLSLIRLTDDAVQKLIAYFEDCGEDVIVLAFGDHQPALYKTLDEPLNNPTQLQKHLIPYFIWKNYEDDAREMPLTSINYFSTMLMDEAGIALPPYYQFLKEMQQTIPVITGEGIVEDDSYIGVNEVKGEQKELLEKYHILEYAQIFDRSIGDEIFTGVEAE